MRSIFDVEKRCNASYTKGCSLEIQSCKPGFEPRVELLQLADYHRAVHKALRNGKDLEKVIQL
jgi:hypothetical protein